MLKKIIYLFICYLLLVKRSIWLCVIKREESLASVFYLLFLEKGWKRNISMANSVWSQQLSPASPWDVEAVGSGCWGPRGLLSSREGAPRWGGCSAVGWRCSWRALCLHDQGFMLQENNATRDRVRFGFLCFNCWRIQGLLLLLLRSCILGAVGFFVCSCLSSSWLFHPWPRYSSLLQFPYKVVYKA